MNIAPPLMIGRKEELDTKRQTRGKLHTLEKERCDYPKASNNEPSIVRQKRHQRSK